MDLELIDSLRLKPIDFLTIQKYFQDFQKHSKSYEMPPDSANYFGIYLEETLIGYFILVGYSDHSLEINQGYLKPKARHANLPTKCVELVEELAKKNGYTKVILQTTSRFRSYLKFMKGMNFQPERLIFSKVV